VTAAAITIGSRWIAWAFGPITSEIGLSVTSPGNDAIGPRKLKIRRRGTFFCHFHAVFFFVYFFPFFFLFFFLSPFFFFSSFFLLFSPRQGNVFLTQQAKE